MRYSYKNRSQGLTRVLKGKSNVDLTKLHYFGLTMLVNNSRLKFDFIDNINTFFNIYD